ncbi:Copper/zinc superoxide dismutase-domain-containing protein [Chytriomyces sp. MP71]|nr:Copper/zinc superoxide dismutase-domain-containing protein [Chytriomyces sp. MP71]
MTQIKAIAHIQPTTGQSISGTLLLSQDDGTTTLSLNLTGGAPNSTHGFHLHAFGDMSDPKGANAFGHFNPSNASHGCPDAGQTSPIKLKTGFHFGDLGSITVDNNGNAKQTWISTELDLNDSSTLGFVLGRGVIVHNMTDDCTTQPTGNSGSRLAQGVIATAGEDHVYETQNVPPASKDNAIAVFKGSVSGNVVAIKHAAADQLVLKYNLTGLPTNQSFNLAVTEKLRMDKTAKTLFHPLQATSQAVLLVKPQ